MFESFYNPSYWNRRRPDGIRPFKLMEVRQATGRFCTARYLATLAERCSSRKEAVRRNFVIVCPGAVIFWSNHDVASQINRKGVIMSASGDDGADPELRKYAPK